MMDIKAIQNRLEYYQITVRQMTGLLDRNEEPVGSPMRKHLSQGIAEAALGLYRAKVDLRAAEGINERKELANV